MRGFMELWVVPVVGGKWYVVVMRGRPGHRNSYARLYKKPTQSSLHRIEAMCGSVSLPALRESGEIITIRRDAGH